ncbi:MAG TPA: ATP-binding protein [Beijerinckiaceae bacterium]|nr:ATP-binding protein [Beijerinckiaceae bacterium]
MNRSTHTLFWLGLITVGAILGAALGTTLELRYRDIADARRELTSLDLLLVEETSRSLQSVDLVLRSVETRLLSDGVIDAESYARKEAGHDMYAFLQGRIAGLPQLAGLTLLAADGRRINFSRDAPVPEVNFADRDFFQALQKQPSDRPFVSDPVENRGTGTWTVHLGRRVSTKDGTFVGFVLGAIDVSYFENLYRSLRLGEGGGVSLWRRDGILLARYPRIPGIGQHLPIKSFDGMLDKADFGTYETERSLDGPSRLVATAAAKDFPIVVNVTRTFDQILTDWRKAALTILGIATVAALAAAFALWTLMRQLGAYEELAVAVSEREKAIKDREAIEAQFRQAQKLEAVGQLTGGIAHDFNNLLTVILGGLETIRRRLPALPRSADTARIARAADMAVQSVESAATLTHRLLAFSRNQPLDPKILGSDELIQSMTELLRRTLGEKIDLETRFSEGLWHIRADPNQLENAILNLAVNSRDAMPEGGRLTIETRNVVLEESFLKTLSEAAPPGPYVLIGITDTGTGMDQATLERAFEPFYTTKEVGKGTGLGLSQVYGFVRQSKGVVKIYSEVGGGTSVKIYLPRHEEHIGTAAGAAVAPQIQTPRGAETILVVEDHEDLRHFDVQVLEDLGYKVISAPDGPSAIKLLEMAGPIDLLFTDVVLPGRMNGRNLADAAIASAPGLKVLFTSGYTRDAIVSNGTLEMGAAVLPKPFTYKDLAEKVRRVLDA